VAIVHQVLSAPDLIEVYAYASSNLAKSEPNEQDRMFKSWSVKWRKEALEHYLKLGWSFIARDQHTKQAVGYFLAQPFLFFRGQTQTLWVEHIEANDAAIRKDLVDIAVKVAREKHLQRVLFAEASALSKELESWYPESLESDIAVVKTTKG
jgi:hypothetical protein